MVDNIYVQIRNLKNKALEDKVPIMQDEGINFLTKFIDKKKVKSVLEIGTAVGYSSIVMAISNPSLKIVTIERDEQRYLEAVKNIKSFKLEDRITIIYKEALDVNIDQKFDLIFIDAAKGQNMKFFDKFSNNLNDKGYIITDNINFHGFVNKKEEEIKSRNLRQLIRKIKNYISFLKGNKNFETVFYDIGDGLSVSKKK